MKRVLVAAAGLLLAVPPPALLADAFNEKTAGFSIAFKDEISSYRDAAVFVLPGTSLAVSARGPAGDYGMAALNGDVDVVSGTRWVWHAPNTPGLYDVEVHGPEKTRSITLHAFVKVPAAEVKNGWLNGYHIGDYPAKPLNGNAHYLPPDGFVEVTKANEHTRLSPHFELRQFVCKQTADKEFPKYVVLQERLPLKLEAVLQVVNTLGFHVDTLHVMSGYRTPFYNHAIGDVLYSMHQWGSAADVFVDRENKGRMDDLNRDNRVDVQDAKFLYDELERMLAAPEHLPLQGGMGFYPATGAHPPFVHVDVRGSRARWKG